MIPLFNARIPPTAGVAVAKVLESGFVGNGAEVRAFETALARYLNVAPEQIVATNSCSGALYLAMRLVGAEHRHVITTPMTFIATSAAIRLANAQIHWADVERTTCQIDPADVERQLREHPLRPSAVVAVCWSGWMPDLTRLRALCDTYHVPLILDAAPAFGAAWRDRFVHEYADITCYSFGPTKHLYAGDGGALLTSPRWAEHARRLAWFGMRREREGGEQYACDQDIAVLGYKFHMTNLSAAIGLASLEVVTDAIHAARINARWYDRVLDRHTLDDESPTPFLYTVFVYDPDGFIAHCRERGIEAGRPHRRNDANTAFRASWRELRNTDAVEASYVSIPVGWWLSEGDRTRICGALSDYRMHHTVCGISRPS